jgi:Golgi nucleoside diphosphatase
MYMVSPEVLQRYTHARSKLETTHKREWVKKKKTRRKLSPQSDYDKWSEKLLEEDVTRKKHLKDILNFMKNILPEKRHYPFSPSSLFR